MGELLLLREAQIRRIEPFFPLPHGVPRVNDRRVLSGMLFVIRNGLRWRDAPSAYGLRKTIYNRFVRWSRMGVFDRILTESAKSGGSDRLTIDATHLKAHRTVASLLKRSLPRCIGRSRGGLTSKLHTVCDGRGRPVLLRLTAGQTSDYQGAVMMVDALRAAKTMLADRAYDARRFRQALSERGITPLHPAARLAQNPAE